MPGPGPRVVLEMRTELAKLTWNIWVTLLSPLSCLILSIQCSVQPVIISPLLSSPLITLTLYDWSDPPTHDLSGNKMVPLSPLYPHHITPHQTNCSAKLRMRSNKSYNNNFFGAIFLLQKCDSVGRQNWNSASVSRCSPAWPGLISLRIYTDL